MIHTGDCVEVMAGMDAASVDAIVTDPPYGLEFMGKEWDRLDAGLPQENVWKGRRGKGGSNVGNDDSGPASRHHVAFGGGKHGFKRCTVCGKRAFSGSPCQCAEPRWVIEYPDGAPSSSIRMQRWHEQWATEALRVAKPGAYLLAFGGTRTYHRLACAIEDAGWIIRDCLVWAYAQGFPKGRANLKPAWEPIVMARKPGPLRELAIDECRIGIDMDTEPDTGAGFYARRNAAYPISETPAERSGPLEYGLGTTVDRSFKQGGRWPANVLLTATEDGRAIFDGDVDGVVGGGAVDGEIHNQRATSIFGTPTGMERKTESVRDTGTYSRFFLLPKADRGDREPILNPYCICKTAKLPAWENEDRRQPARTAATSPQRVTSEATSTDGFGWLTSLSGSETSEPSRLDSRSTTSTVTSRTTGSPTSSLSTPLPTNGSTPAANSSTVSGGSGAPSAISTDPSPLNGGTSHPKAGPSTGDAGPATSAASLKRSVCGECGKEVMPSRRERFNAHPT